MNKELKRLLLQEIQRTNELIEKVEAMQENAPEGSLRIFKHGTNYQYYQVRLHERNYISKKKPELALQLAQKEYNSTVLDKACALRRQMHLLNQILEQNDVENIDREFSEEMRKLITPYFVSEEEYIEQWNAFDFEPKVIDDTVPVLFTNRGERVRSKSEKIIADKLANMGVPYRYEAPLVLSGYGTVYPDFTMLKLFTRENIYWDHFGMMDDKSYCEKAMTKINTYIRNGYIPGKNLLLTFESRSCPINMNSIEKQIRSILDL